MSHFYQNTLLSYKEAEKRLNDHLHGLEIVNIQNGMSETKHLYLTIFSKTHDENYSFSLGTDSWIWKDARGREVPVFKSEFDDHGMFRTTSEIKMVLENKSIIERVELSENSKLIQVNFEDGSVLQAQEDLTSEDQSYYQLRLLGSKLYQNYNLTTHGSSWLEESMYGEEHGDYRVGMFDLDYFRAEHRNFTTNAIIQARKRKSPISFIQARVLYCALTTSSEFSFLAWKLRRSSIKKTRLDTIPADELITITRQECIKNNFTIEEAKDILKTTIGSFKEWIRTEKNLATITDQEYGSSDNFSGLIKWYEETL